MHESVVYGFDVHIQEQVIFEQILQLHKNSEKGRCVRLVSH